MLSLCLYAINLLLNIRLNSTSSEDEKESILKLSGKVKQERERW